jgi:hypothetical protein
VSEPQQLNKCDTNCHRKEQRNTNQTIDQEIATFGGRKPIMDFDVEFAPGTSRNFLSSSWKTSDRDREVLALVIRIGMVSGNGKSTMSTCWRPDDLTRLEDIAAQFFKALREPS